MLSAKRLEENNPRGKIIFPCLSSSDEVHEHPHESAPIAYTSEYALNFGVSSILNESKRRAQPPMGSSTKTQT